MSIAADAPDVQVMHFVYAIDFSNCLLDAHQVHAAGRALQQDVQAFADDPD